MKVLEDLQHRFLFDLRTAYHDYEIGLNARLLVTPQGRYRDTLRRHLGLVRDRLADVEDLAEATLREVREDVRRRSAAGYVKC